MTDSIPLRNIAFSDSMDQDHKRSLAATLFTQSWNERTVEELLSQIDKERSIPALKKSVSPLEIAIEKEKRANGNCARASYLNIGYDE